MFGSLKEVPRGCRFELREGVKAVLLQKIQQSREIFAEGIQYNSWCMNGTIFNGLYSTQNNSKTSFI
jgi:hypothetical protein